MKLREVEKKWQKKWNDTGLYKFNKDILDKKYYLMEMFSYPSGANLHLGHWFNYSLADSFGRFKRMKGYNVFHPIGFDAFGLPAENYALKTGTHPRVSTEKNIAIMENQLSEMGTTYDWDYEIKTCNEDYYKWTQWLFLKLYENKLAYQKLAPINWCTNCNTVLANEQVVGGVCERCKSEVIKKNMKQWFLKITDYADNLLSDIDVLDWPEKTKIAQKNWIGKSVGAEVVFSCENGEEINVFTSRIDTIFGVSFLALAPENQLVEKLTTEPYRAKINEYINLTIKKDDIIRQSTTEEKTGVFTGSYAINPANNEQIPIFIADYVLNTYATGAVMGVPAHDERDYLFAKKYNLTIKRVIKGGELPYCEYGDLTNSKQFDNMSGQNAKLHITKWLEQHKKASSKTNYKLRDWSVSRQRYWGCPIPIIYCEKCGCVPVPEKDLPVKLPENVDFTPDGTSPLKKCKDFLNTSCPICQGKAIREADTLDTFMCSSWYYLRYPNAKDDKCAFDSEFTNKLLPVDKYVGGMEHATGHLLYSRFITKFLHQTGYVNFNEPFKSLIHQGMILGQDGQKMSKSRGNTINLDSYIEEYGSDCLRLYLAFGFNFQDGGPWNDNGIKGIAKFLERVERIILKKYKANNYSEKHDSEEKELEYTLNYSIKECEQNMEEFSFNSAVARIMELVNALYKYDLNEQTNSDLIEKSKVVLIKLLSPFTPHFAEELWQQLGYEYSIHNQSYPKYDPSKLVLNSVEIAVQINSKIITRISINPDLDTENICKIALENEKIQLLVANRTIIKKIYISKSLLNIIVK